jgi:protease-4
LGFLDYENLSRSLFVAARWKPLAVSLAREDDVLHWQFSLGGGLPSPTSSFPNVFSGVTLSLFSGEGYTDVAATLGIGYGVTHHFLVEVALRDLVLSRNAGGSTKTFYDIAFYLGAPDALFTLEGIYSIPLHNGEHSGLGAKLFFRPTSGLEISLGMQWEKHEWGFGAGVGLGFGGVLFGRVGYAHSNGRHVLGASFVAGDPGHGDILASDDTFLEVVVGDSISEQAKEGNILFGAKDTPGFASRLFALYRACHEKSLKLVVVRLRDNALGYARSEELMEALLVLRRYGKGIVAVLEKGGLRNLLIASAANEIYIDPYIQMEIAGPAMTASFYKGFLDKLGIEAELFARDAYKTAPQSYTEQKMTPEHRESANRILLRVRERVFARIAENRAFTAEQVAAWCAKGLMTPAEALREGVVTHIGSYASLGKLLQRYSLVPQTLESFLTLPQGFVPNNAIAVITIEGTIVNGTSSGFSLPFFGKSAGADTIIAALHEALRDKYIRGIIIRVESGGGDVLASARMREAITHAAKRKPLVISMGDVAASGGFWLACGDEETKLDIYAGAMSLTGSIGVFAGKVSTEKLRAKLGIESERLGDPNAHMFSDDKGFTPEQRAMINKMLDYWYDQFVDLVAAGRHMARDEVLKSAGGRVWAGDDARTFGLVDHNEGLMGAYLALVQRMHGNPMKYTLIEYPKARFGLANLVTGGLEASLTALSDPEAWPGILVHGNSLALLPFTPEFD